MKFTLLSDELLIESYIKSLSPKFDQQFREQLLNAIIERNLQEFLNVKAYLG
ncbi:sporulation histidine kinase inhibitor Sda [Bacillus suaedaesalsae]|uniref:Sporulation histidine kinase inhibitor Sda n=1 Tax=Bacillus suaedaesalsae TaxID=2810349 RepID=A0ABS2DKB8_9BACI|nr:sporulation histidine kinase inhibitor Sda [Bacillus suaedaesalsae]MBM6617908.1 sporulation histidine kinase inhibitor Sda [Bacillus suaedaesalsae]